MFLWHYLKTLTVPVLIYGMGNGAEKILSEANRYGIPIDGVFSSDDRARQVSFQGFPVSSIGYVLENYDEAAILVGFGVYQEEVIQRILTLPERFQVFVPDVPLMDGEILTPEAVSARQNEINAARSLLEDEKSRRVFDTMLHAKLTGIPGDYLLEDTPRSENMSLLQLGQSENYLDLGAYNGDTIFEFLELTGGYRAIYAFEPDPHNFKKLSAAVASLDDLTLYPYASWNESTTLTFSGKGGRNCAMLPSLPGQYKHLHPVEAVPVDSLNLPCSYVKMDVEGAEAQTLLGMQQLLNTHHPKLLISCYHKPDDFITIPLLLNKLCPGYRMYMRRNRCFPAWEIQLYCIYGDFDKNS